MNLHEFCSEIQEALRLHIVEDPPSTPYLSRYRSREKLERLLNVVKDPWNYASSSESVESGLRCAEANPFLHDLPDLDLHMYQGVLECLLARNYIECEELSHGVALGESGIRKLIVFPLACGLLVADTWCLLATAELTRGKSMLAALHLYRALVLASESAHASRNVKSGSGETDEVYDKAPSAIEHSACNGSIESRESSSANGNGGDRGDSAMSVASDDRSSQHATPMDPITSNPDQTALQTNASTSPTPSAETSLNRAASLATALLLYKCQPQPICVSATVIQLDDEAALPTLASAFPFTATLTTLGLAPHLSTLMTAGPSLLLAHLRQQRGTATARDSEECSTTDDAYTMSCARISAPSSSSPLASRIPSSACPSYLPVLLTLAHEEFSRATTIPATHPSAKHSPSSTSTSSVVSTPDIATSTSNSTSASPRAYASARASLPLPALAAAESLARVHYYLAQLYSSAPPPTVAIATRPQTHNAAGRSGGVSDTSNSTDMGTGAGTRTTHDPSSLIALSPEREDLAAAFSRSTLSLALLADALPYAQWARLATGLASFLTQRGRLATAEHCLRAAVMATVHGAEELGTGKVCVFNLAAAEEELVEMETEGDSKDEWVGRGKGEKEGAVPPCEELIRGVPFELALVPKHMRVNTAEHDNELSQGKNEAAEEECEDTGEVPATEDSEATVGEAQIEGDEAGCVWSTDDWHMRVCELQEAWARMYAAMMRKTVPAEQEALTYLRAVVAMKRELQTKTSKTEGSTTDENMTTSKDTPTNTRLRACVAASALLDALLRGPRVTLRDQQRQDKEQDIRKNGFESGNSFDQNPQLEVDDVKEDADEDTASGQQSRVDSVVLPLPTTRICGSGILSNKAPYTASVYYTAPRSHYPASFSTPYNAQLGSDLGTLGNGADVGADMAMWVRSVVSLALGVIENESCCSNTTESVSSSHMAHSSPPTSSPAPSRSSHASAYASWLAHDARAYAAVAEARAETRRLAPLTAANVVLDGDVRVVGEGAEMVDVSDDGEGEDSNSDAGNGHGSAGHERIEIEVEDDYTERGKQNERSVDVDVDVDINIDATVEIDHIPEDDAVRAHNSSTLSVAPPNATTASTSASASTRRHISPRWAAVRRACTRRGDCVRWEGSMAEVAVLPLASLRGVLALERALGRADAEDEEADEDEEDDADEDSPAASHAVTHAAVPVRGLSSAIPRAEPLFPQLEQHAVSACAPLTATQVLRTLEATLRHTKAALATCPLDGAASSHVELRIMAAQAWERAAASIAALARTLARVDAPPHPSLPAVLASACPAQMCLPPSAALLPPAPLMALMAAVCHHIAALCLTSVLPQLNPVAFAAHVREGWLQVGGSQAAVTSLLGGLARGDYGGITQGGDATQREDAGQRADVTQRDDTARGVSFLAACSETLLWMVCAVSSDEKAPRMPTTNVDINIQADGDADVAAETSAATSLANASRLRSLRALLSCSQDPEASAAQVRKAVERHAAAALHAYATAASVAAQHGRPLLPAGAAEHIVSTFGWECGTDEVLRGLREHSGADAAEGLRHSLMRVRRGARELYLRNGWMVSANMGVMARMSVLAEPEERRDWVAAQLGVAHTLGLLPGTRVGERVEVLARVMSFLWVNDCLAREECAEEAATCADMGALLSSVMARETMYGSM